MKTTLLLVDIQNDYFPGGRMELDDSPATAAQARRLLGLFRERGWSVVHVQHVSTRPGATFFLPATPGVEIHPEVAPLPGETVIQKHFPNSFRETPLLEHLQGLGTGRLTICGMMTHMCVDAAVRAAADFGFQVVVAADACATRTLVHDGTTIPAAHVQAAYLSAFKAYGQVMTVDEVQALLTQD
ncbi:MAG: cysteine hydrolase [Anaerolineales bacterium]|nr:cysteine hydrolase [Anaerolineales bacterium]